ncbi:bifunctional 2-polyprenyl-6-hydroxyphenol methylase/3-demethylubiquinol 3-O-methyltransferase UbiG [Desulfopila sp. IMCC35008]|uniref:class I SAM-dependent methyltransferase n=1 Tax=Desulfopila sp. IMCC35008 TaxID=2653858 RepID=UPI001F0D0D55|nr:class I SAM-dependent methyltransferase [Desulfopila sp. IMCC35008]
MFYTYNSYPESKLIMEMLPSWNNKKVLEIGCGEGRLAAMISFAGAKTVDATDYSEEAIKIARSNFHIENVTYQCSDYRDFKQKYDVVVLQGVLEHLDNPFEELKNIFYTCVNEGGWLITSSPSFINPRGYVWMALQLLLDVPMSLTDLHFLCPFDFEEFASRYDLELEYKSTDFDWASGDRLIIDFEKRLRNALRDANLDNSKVDRFLKWLEKAAPCHLHDDRSGTTIAYRFKKKS